jgi:hypothetical protein
MRTLPTMCTIRKTCQYYRWYACSVITSMRFPPAACVMSETILCSGVYASQFFPREQGCRLRDVRYLSPRISLLCESGLLTQGGATLSARLAPGPYSSTSLKSYAYFVLPCPVVRGIRTPVQPTSGLRGRGKSVPRAAQIGFLLGILLRPVACIRAQWWTL